MMGRLRKRSRPKVSGCGRVDVKSSPEKADEDLDPETTEEPLLCSLKRSRGQTQQTSTPVHTGDPLTPPHSPHSAREKEDCTEKISQTPTRSSPRHGGRITRLLAERPRRVKKLNTKEKTLDCLKKPAAKSRRVGRKKRETTVPPATRARPRFELKADESTASSDLSIELSSFEEPPPPLLTFEEGEECDDDDDDDELPSFLQVDKKPASVTEGGFVWYRHRSFPFWPALVKRVNRKRRKASIMFVDKPVIHNMKGFSVPLSRLKPFDCEDAAELVNKAKEEYKDLIEWTMDLIDDYMIRIACGSFSGSFVNYLAHNMSFPVRRKFPQTEGFVFSSEETWEDEDCEDSKDNLEHEKDQEGSARRLLPDRALAAYNRANEKLVDYIVQKRKVEARLLAVIQGQEPSRWLRSFQSSKRRRRRRIINIYLEDSEQLDQVYRYLDQIYSTSVADACCPAAVKSAEKVPFIMDVLLPEAIMYAIAGVDSVSVEKAEKKYLNGRSLSNREREELDMMIGAQQKSKGLQQRTSDL